MIKNDTVPQGVTVRRDAHALTRIACARNRGNDPSPSPQWHVPGSQASHGVSVSSTENWAGLWGWALGGPQRTGRNVGIGVLQIIKPASSSL